MKKLFLWLTLAVATTISTVGQETKSELKTRFDVIRNETVPGANTKTRVADAYQKTSDATQSVYYAVAAGTDTYTTTVLNVTSYAGKWFAVQFTNGNTGAASLNINGIGAVPIVKSISTPVVSGDILAGSTYFLSFDGTNFRLGGSSPQDAAADGATKGIATFTAVDFNSSSGLISIDYANGQEASGSQDGFLSSTDWTTFNNKQSTGLSYLLASGGTATGINTFTFNTANQLNYSGTWTATANNQYYSTSGGSITARGTSNDVLNYEIISPTLTSSAAGQTLIAEKINPTFNDGAFTASKIWLQLGSDTDGIAFINPTSATRGLEIQTKATWAVYALSVNANSNNATSPTLSAFQITGTFNPSSGNNQYNIINIPYTYNFTGGTRTVVGVNYDPLLTAVSGVTNLAWRSTSGSFLVGNTNVDVITANTRFDIRALSNSTDIAFRVATSGNTEIFKVLGNGDVTAATGTTISFTAATTFNITGANGQLVMSGTSSQVRSQSYRAANTSVTMSILDGDATTGIIQSHYAGTTFTNTSGALARYVTSHTFAPTSGTATWTQFLIGGTINQTGGANGQITGYGYAATITAAVNVTGFDYNPTTPANISGTEWAYRSTSGGISFASGTTDIVKFTHDNIVTTPVEGYGLWLANTTAATSGVPAQYSPSTTWEGQAWKTNATAASQSVKFMADVHTAQGGDRGQGTWRLRHSINGGAYEEVISINTGQNPAGAISGDIIIGANNGKLVRLRSNALRFDAQGGSSTIEFTANGGSVSWGLGTMSDPTGATTFSIGVTLTTTAAHNHFYLPTTVNSTSTGTLKAIIPAFTFTDWDGDVIGYSWDPVTPANIAGNHYAFVSSSGRHGFGTLTPTYQAQVTGTSANQNLFLVEENGGVNIFEAAEVSGTNRIGFFAVTPAIQQSVNTILVNNVTSGGSLSTIANFTDLTTYSNDAATIRNNFFRLAEKVLKLETALRNYGLAID